MIDIYSEERLRSFVVKYGATTQLTRGSLAPDGIHVRIHNLQPRIDEKNRVEQQTRQSPMYQFNPDTEMAETTESIESSSFVMFGQAEIESHTYSNPFFDKGDSGAMVFCVDDADRDILKCIGLAIGHTSYDTCIMTPIKHILKSLNNLLDPKKERPPLTFKTFSQTRPQSTPRAASQAGQQTMPFDAAAFMTMISATLDQKLKPISEDICGLKELKEDIGGLKELKRDINGLKESVNRIDMRLVALENVGNTASKRPQNDQDTDEELWIR